MNFRVKITRHFQKEAKHLLKKYPSFEKDISNFIDELSLNPEQGTPLGHGLYKARVAIKSKNQGKSGGARVITYIILKDEIAHLVSVYDKAVYDTAEVNLLLKILAEEGL